MYNLKLNNFEGPLDLLLQLIDSADLDITEVALSEVADQFMGYLEQVEERRPEILADFLVIASKLLLIKSKALLPSLEIEGDEEGIDLEQQLKMYKDFFEAAKKVEQILLAKNFMFSREKLAVDVDVIFNPPKKISAVGLKDILLSVIENVKPIVKLPQRTLERAVSIKEKIANIRSKILQNIQMNFSDLVKDSNNRTDVVVTFLGILELVKQRVVTVDQEKKFGDISISRLDQNQN